MVSTSLAETFGMSVTEAAALGIPSIVFKGTATEEIIENHETGFIVESEKEFILRIGEIIDNSYFLNKIGENARSMALKKFRIDKIVNQYDSVYSDLKS
jgi:glycosyltransferase involved in cell wall biosynthesis